MSAVMPSIAEIAAYAAASSGSRTRDSARYSAGDFPLGRDCAFAVVHAVDLPAAVARYGERVYRYVHLEAGLIGERLDLAALRLGHGASGIGGFFDEFLNDLLLLSARHAVAYITTIGVPAPVES